MYVGSKYRRFLISFNALLTIKICRFTLKYFPLKIKFHPSAGTVSDETEMVF